MPTRLVLFLVGWFAFLSVTAAATIYQYVLAGNIQYQLTSVADKNTWVITPRNPSATKILVVFTAMNMRQGEVRVYDTSAINDGSILYNCASCGSTLPPPFYSDTGSITIISNAINGVGFQSSGFALQFIAAPTAETTVLKSTYVSLNMGMAPIFPFAFNGFLLAGTDQRWAINTGAQIVFSFSSFNLPSGCTAVLEIHNRITGTSDSSLLFRGCSNADAPTAWLYSATGQALVILKTTARSSVDFQLNYASDVNMFRCGSIDQPFIMTDTSMLLADGSKSTTLMQRGVTCTWRITPTVGAPVRLVMNRVSLKFGSSVTVYDGDSDSGAVLWGAVGATLTLPPVITSTGQSLFVRYASDSSPAIRYFGFEGDYMSNFLGSRGSGKGYTQLGMSSELDITPPGDGRTHTAGVSYIWYIAPAGSTGPITFALSLLRLTQPGTRLLLLEGTAGNTGGELGGVAQSYAVGTRTVLAEYTGSVTPTDWVRTRGTSATVIFESNTTSGTSLDDFFQLAYFSDGPNYHCGFTTNPAVLRMQSFIITDGSSSTERAYPGQLCQWQLMPPDATAIVLVFERFHLFNGYLRVYVGSGPSKVLYAEIGDTGAVPAPITIASGVVSLEYATITTAPVTGFGFALTYYGISSPSSFPGSNIVTLASSSVVSLSLPTTQILPSTSLKWLVAPSSSTGRIYLAISKLNLSEDCSLSRLDIYDGADASAPLLRRLCGRNASEEYSWVQTTGSTALLHFATHPSLPSQGNFDLGYFADGPNYHCGFAVNPARMTAPSMVFTDGSGSEAALFRNQHCEWVIQPSSFQETGLSTSTSVTRVVAELSECDLAGASIAVYDGASDQAPLLWGCEGCNSTPGALISTTDKIFVRFRSTNSGPFGTGFRLVYWTTTAAALQRTGSQPFSPSLLLLPTGVALTDSASNSSTAFFLSTTSTPSTMTFSPFYTTTTTTTLPPSSYADGRVVPSVFDWPERRVSSCGVITNNGGNRLVGQSVSYASLQRPQQYLQAVEDRKELLSLQGADRDRARPYSTQKGASFFDAPGVCKYRLESGSPQAVQIDIQRFLPQSNGRLLVYGGLSSEDAVLFDSNQPELHLSPRSQYVETITTTGARQQSVSLVAPCGQATIILLANNTALNRIDYSLTMDYSAIATDSGQKCRAYWKSLQPSEGKKDPTATILVACGTFAGCCLAFAVFYYASKLKAELGYYCYPYGLAAPSMLPSFVPRTRVKIIRATPAHPRYSARWNTYLNSFLRRGECCVCKSTDAVVMKLSCTHSMCLEDIKGYLESALGDISMFPMKCPMHYAGCSGGIDAYIAKRVLTEVQYSRFNEFADRAAYGDGMRCIFCYNYVSFPESMEHVARVVCPYCQQNFCVRCKQAWHNNRRCAVDTYDASLEVWKNKSGAQKCPACKKLIEKDDPDTCNHMVHKITDGIPCIRDRTDFCYCCGEEVTPDYPHDEVAHRGVNHFPDGVFQRCRRIAQQEKEAERERQRKARRKRPSAPSRPEAADGVSADGPISSPLPARGSGLSLIHPAAGADTEQEAVRLLEQQYDIESPAATRPQSRSTGMSTPFLSPSPNRVQPVAGNGYMEVGMDSPVGTRSPAVRINPSAESVARPATSGGRVVPASAVYNSVIPANPFVSPSAGSTRSTGSAGVAAGPSSSGRSSAANPVAASTGSSRGGSGLSGAGSPARPFSTLEQQMHYQQVALAATRPSASSPAPPTAAASPSPSRMLLGSPATRGRMVSWRDPNLNR